MPTLLFKFKSGCAVIKVLVTVKMVCAIFIKSLIIKKDHCYNQPFCSPIWIMLINFVALEMLGAKITRPTGRKERRKRLVVGR